MTKKQILKVVNSVIGDCDNWIEFYLNNVSVGVFKIDDKYGSTKKEILSQFYVEKLYDGRFNIWWYNKHCYACITFDYCQANSSIRI